jgi:hypothetical protein
MVILSFHHDEPCSHRILVSFALSFSAPDHSFGQVAVVSSMEIEARARLHSSGVGARMFLSGCILNPGTETMDLSRVQL